MYEYVFIVVVEAAFSMLSIIMKLAFCIHLFSLPFSSKLASVALCIRLSH